MSIFSQTAALFRREVMLEQRQKYTLFCVLLYVVSTVFICKFCFRSIKDVPTWNALFWIILLFAAATGVARSFAQESRGRLLYLYTLADPRAILLAKLAYNSVLMTCLGLAGLLIYSFLIGYPVENTGMFIVALFFGCTGLAAAFTMISAIASKAGQNFTLMAILGFPVVLPLLLCAIRLSMLAILGFEWSGDGFTYFGVLASLNVSIIALSYLLFPYLWRD